MPGAYGGGLYGLGLYGIGAAIGEQPVTDLSILPGTFELYEPTSYGRVRLPISGATGIDVARVGVFPSRQISADFRKVDHEWLSAYAQSDWLGGGQLDVARESTQSSRYSGVATLETRFPGKLTLLPFSEALDGPADVTQAMVLGDYDDGDPVRCFVAYDNIIKEVASTDLFGEWVLDSAPVAAACRFRIDDHDQFFIPLSDGWQQFTPAALGAKETLFAPLMFLVFDNKLWTIDVDGWIWRNQSGLLADWSRVIQVRDGSRPRHLQRFRNASGNPAILAITNKGALALDPAVPSLYETDASYPGHPDAALASARWRQELYITYGMDIGVYTLSTWTFRGLVRDNGVPQELKGAIVSLADGFNDLFLLINGQQDSVLEEEWVPVWEGELVWPEVAARSYIMRLNSDGGFHTAWMSPELGDLATNLVVSENYDGYWLYWGWNGQIWAQELSRQFLNPLDNDTARYMVDGELISSWQTLNTEAIRMLLAAIEIRAGDITATETIDIWYQLDKPENEWIHAATFDDTTPEDELGIRRLRANPAFTMPDGTTHYEGHEFSRVRYKLRFERMDEAEEDCFCSAFIESVALIYMPMMGSMRSFNIEVDCSSPEFDQHEYGMTNGERRAFIDLLPSMPFLGFSHGAGQWRSVKCTGVSGVDATGQDLRGNRSVSFIETWSTTTSD